MNSPHRLVCKQSKEFGWRQSWWQKWLRLWTETVTRENDRLDCRQSGSPEVVQGNRHSQAARTGLVLTRGHGRPISHSPSTLEICQLEFVNRSDFSQELFGYIPVGEIFIFIIQFILFIYLFFVFVFFLFFCLALIYYSRADWYLHLRF